MKVYVIVCCDSFDNSIVFVDSIRKNKQDAIDYCNAQNTVPRNQAAGIYFDWEEDTVLQHIKVGEKSPIFISKL